MDWEGSAGGRGIVNWDALLTSSSVMVSLVSHSCHDERFCGEEGAVVVWSWSKTVRIKKSFEATSVLRRWQKTSPSFLLLDFACFSYLRSIDTQSESFQISGRWDEDWTEALEVSPSLMALPVASCHLTGYLQRIVKESCDQDQSIPLMPKQERRRRKIEEWRRRD